MLEFNKIGSVSVWCLRCGTLLCWGASLSVCMPFSLVQTDSELLFSNLEGSSGGHRPFNQHSHHGLIKGFLGWKMYFSSLEFFSHVTHWILPPTLRGWELCERTCLLCASAGVKCHPQTLIWPAISDADKWCCSESGIGESWFGTVVKGKGKVWQYMDTGASGRS